MEFHELTPKRKKFYRNVYAAIDHVWRKIERYKKEGDCFQATMFKLFLNDLFKEIRKMEKELIDEEIDVLNLEMGNFFEVQKKLYHINNEINKQYSDLFNEFLENIEEKL